MPRAACPASDYSPQQRTILGMRLGRADFISAPHNDPDAFEDSSRSWRKGGGVGALLCGSRTFRDFLVNRGRGFVFSTALSPLMASAVREPLRISLTLNANPASVEALADALADALA